MTITKETHFIISGMLFIPDDISELNVSSENDIITNSHAQCSKYIKTNRCTYVCLSCFQIRELYHLPVTGEPVPSTSPLTPAMSKQINCRLFRAWYLTTAVQKRTFKWKYVKQVHHKHEYKCHYRVRHPVCWVSNYMKSKTANIRIT